ncbi:MAG: phosphate acyltransferase, partial [Elusimicrobiota bacterium]|nr:phosphate acyltransferase [Elusimicrobiota bacterium]
MISDFLRKKALKNPAKVLLPEGGDTRILEAAQKAAQKKVCFPVVLLDVAQDNRIADKLKRAGCEVLFTDEKLKQECAQKWAEIKKIDIAAAKELVENKMHLSAALLSLNYADAMVAGAVHSTKDVLKPALEARKLYPGIPPVTSSFIMEIPKFGKKENELFIFADCGLNIEPSAAILAHIANAANSIAKDICGLEPKIAFLSFSSLGSAEHSSIDKMREALKITKRKFPSIKADGELQADAAIVDWIGKAKAPESSVAGKANVLIFPDLNSGNIAYKLVERLAGAKAIG